MSNLRLRRYHLELAHKFQIENPQWSVGVECNGDYVHVVICGFDDDANTVDFIMKDSYSDDFTSFLEHLVKHGYNPEVSA